MGDLFGSPDMPAGMSADDRKGLLEYENTLAAERDEKARQFQREQERQRKSQEREIRKAEEQQERERINQLEQQERAAAGAVEDPLEAQRRDRDSRLTQMWGSLSSQVDPTTSVEEQRPE